MPFREVVPQDVLRSLNIFSNSDPIKVLYCMSFCLYFVYINFVI